MCFPRKIQAKINVFLSRKNQKNAVKNQLKILIFIIANRLNFGDFHNHCKQKDKWVISQNITNLTIIVCILCVLSKEFKQSLKSILFCFNKNSSRDKVPREPGNLFNYSSVGL